jgi:hypothetical protein
MNLFIYVEGQEEEMFVNRVLRGYLQPFGVVVQKPILAATSFRMDDDGDVTVGGVTNYNSIQKDIQNLYASGNIQPEDALTTLIDLYALPLTFPGHQESISQGLSAGRKADFIEQAWKADVNQPHFHPYIQTHEFETLILTQPSVLKLYYPEYASKIEQLCRECAAFASPEDINGTKATSPSHRILHQIPTYLKEDGFRHLQEIGISELKKQCPRFKTWVEKCETGFR